MLEWPRLDPETGAIVTKAGSAQHDAASGSVTLTTIFEEGGQGEPARRWVRRDRLRLVSADELRGFAEDAGLDRRARWPAATTWVRWVPAASGRSSSRSSRDPGPRPSPMGRSGWGTSGSGAPHRPSWYRRADGTK